MPDNYSITYFTTIKFINDVSSVTFGRNNDLDVIAKNKAVIRNLGRNLIMIR